MVTTPTTPPVHGVRSRRRLHLRLFTSPVEEPRSRRASDGISLALAVFGLAVLSLVAVPSSGIEAGIVAVVDALPTGLDGLWRLFVRVLLAVAVVLVGAALARRRSSLLRDQALAAAAAVLGGLVLGRIVQGTWQVAWTLTSDAAAQAWVPWGNLMLPVAVVAVAIPHLTRAVRRLARWAIALGTVGLLLGGTATPSEAVAALLVGLGASSVVHLVFGSTRGRPRVEDVEAVLASMGVEVVTIVASERQRAGVHQLEAVHVDGRLLDVKVYGGDASDTQFVTALWRMLWFRDAGMSVSPGRVQQVTHEALLTLLAAQAGLVTQPVVTVGVTANDDAVLVLERVGRPVADEGDWDADRVRQLWQLLAALHGAGIIHRQVDADHLMVVDGHMGLVDFRGAAIVSDAWRTRVDNAQALVAGTLAIGIDAAVALAVAALGSDEVAELLPFLQLDACTPSQRRALKDGDIDIDEVRDHVAAALEVEAPELERLRRVTWGSLVQVVLPVLAFVAIASVFAGVDLEDFATALEEASWWYIGVAFVVGQTPQLSNAVSALGASPLPVPLSRLVVLQMAQSYIALSVPSAAARIAMNVRFFQRHGLGAVPAVTVGALDSFFGFVGQMIVLLLVMTLSPATLDLAFSDVPDGVQQVAVIVVGVALVAIATVVGVPRLRRPLVHRVRTTWRDASSALAGLASPRRLGLLLGGNIASEVLFALTLGALTIALGYPIALSQLMLIHVGVSLLAGVMPIPGGIGVVEGGITYGLVVAGMPEESAFAAALLFRTITFYLPPAWGLFAFRWLERNKFL